MPTALRRHQYELLDSSERTLLLFGTEDTGYLTTTRPVFESAELSTNDQAFGVRDGFSFGRDFLASGGIHRFEGQVLTDRINGLGTVNAEAANEAAIEELRTAWRSPRLRDRARNYGILRKVSADGTMLRTYGRPRLIDVVEGNTTDQGATPFVAAFDAYEEGWYSDQVYSTTRRLYVPPIGGVEAPITTPITTTKEVVLEPTEFTVLGKRDVWMTVAFKGPVLNPTATISGTDGFEVGYTGSIPSGQTVEISSAPWARGVRRLSDGAYIPGLVSPRTPPLSALKMKPGQKILTYRGVDATGTTTVTISWRTRRNY